MKITVSADSWSHQIFHHGRYVAKAKTALTPIYLNLSADPAEDPPNFYVVRLE